MLRSIQSHPVALLAVGAVAFAAWLWHDAQPPTAAARTETAGVRPLPPHAGPNHPFPHGDPNAMLAHLPPGVPRVIVEHKLGLHPMPHAVSAVEVGSATYTVSYPLPGRPLVLEFDATQPGHPLVGPRAPEPQS